MLTTWISLALIALQLATATPLQTRACRKTKVAILGAGTAGITAAQALTNASVTDFLILEYNNVIGGRVAHTTFGKKKNGKPYTVELGANWVQGLDTPQGPENPIWTLAKKYNLSNTFSDYTSLQTFTDKGTEDYLSLIDEYGTAFSAAEQDAGYIISQNLQDRSYRAALSLAGWKPKKDSKKQAVEWWQFDWEYALSPDESSEVFAVVNYNTTFYQYSADNNYVWDERGFSTFIEGEVYTFLKKNDPRLLLNTIVTDIAYNNDGVTVTNRDGSCVEADYALCTFSLGVLQNGDVTFHPALPDWKQQGIATMQMGTYTKIFLQFPPDKVFWNKDTQFFLYADPTSRGYYPVWQSLDNAGFLPGSGILFVTVVGQYAYRAEAQSDHQTKAEVLAVLRKMFGARKVPDPIAFMYPRWSLLPWARGSYSNWPPGTTLEMHENLRANVGNLWLAGEHTSAEYYGFLHGAWFEGQLAGKNIATCVKGDGKCENEKHYTTLHGTTKASDYSLDNGWLVTSFQTFGF